MKVGTLPILLRWGSYRRRHTPPDRATRWVGSRPRPSPRLAIGVYRGQEPRHTFGRGQRTYSVSPAAEFVGTRRRFIGIKEHVALRCPCCNAVGVDTRHARICPRAGAQVDQHQPLVHAMSHTLKRLGIRHQEESGKPFSADRNLQMDIVVRRGGLRDAPIREYREKPILLDVTHADPQAQIHLRGGSAAHDGSAASTSEARKRQHYVIRGMRPLTNRATQTCHLSSGKLWASRGRGQ